MNSFETNIKTQNTELKSGARELARKQAEELKKKS
jgi:hypothetical protein